MQELDGIVSRFAPTRVFIDLALQRENLCQQTKNAQSNAFDKYMFRGNPTRSHDGI